MSPTGIPRRSAGSLVALALALGGSAVAASPVPASAAHSADLPDLHLVVLTGPGTAGTRTGAQVDRASLLARQDRVLATLGRETPGYRWTTALNGFTASLTTEQVAAVRRHPEVALVEPNAVRTLAGSGPGAVAAATPASATRPSTAGDRRGAGLVVGVVDSGLDPDHPAFAELPDPGPAAAFRGGCESGEGWQRDDCTRKVVGARWFAAGFGPARVRSSEALSPLDTTGHGTQVASIAAGNAGVPVRLGDRVFADFAGTAPRARVAPYKACWSAPDPEDDGCSTADLVTAVDRATGDGVDVLALAIGDGGGSGIDALDRALLGAAEADVVVVGAAGNDGQHSFAAHAHPWVTTVGGMTGDVGAGHVTVVGGPRLTGASRASSDLGPLPLVTAGAARADGASARDARQCRPGALDAALVSDVVVLCDRGGIGRVDKSAAVARAGGVGMVLANVRRGQVTDDFHAVPTVHLAAGPARRLRSWLHTHPATRVRLGHVAGSATRQRVIPDSPPGDPRGSLLKPDVVAPASGLVAATAGHGPAWVAASGTSMATARVAGLAALLRARHPGWPATTVRAALVTTADPVRGGDPLRVGAGRARSTDRVGLLLEQPAEHYRGVVEGSRPSHRLNLPSVLVQSGTDVVERTVTNAGGRAEYFSVRASGFTAHTVRVTPAAVRLDPGETATFTIRVTGTPGPTGTDGGEVVWTGARGSVTRVPVVIGR